MKRVMLTGLLIAALLLGLAGSVSAAPPQENPGKGPQDLSKIVFIHYPKGLMAKGGIPGPPGGGDNSDKGGKLWYKYSGIHWAEAAVDYWVEDDVSAEFVAAIDSAFNEWEGTDASINFENGGDFDGVPSTYVDAGSTNGMNEIAWLEFSLYDLPSNAIGVTSVWYNAGTGLIVEVDMAMNGDLPWVQNTVIGEPNEAEGELGYYDVQNIATHEVGHWLMLGDLYNKPAKQHTMYGYGAMAEVKKRSLESGDIAGILVIYPAP